MPSGVAASGKVTCPSQRLIFVAVAYRTVGTGIRNVATDEYPSAHEGSYPELSQFQQASKSGAASKVRKFTPGSSWLAEDHFPAWTTGTLNPENGKALQAGLSLIAGAGFEPATSGL